MYLEYLTVDARSATKLSTEDPFKIASGDVFCSLSCCGKNQRIQRICNVCGKKFLGAKKTCSRTCANKARSGIKYLGLNTRNNARQGSLLKEKVATIRGGKCERCGEDNFAILQIHHKKEQSRGGSDKLSNLELLCPNCHATHHLGMSLFLSKKSGTVLPLL